MFSPMDFLSYAIGSALLIWALAFAFRSLGRPMGAVLLAMCLGGGTLADDTWSDPESGRQFCTGAMPTPDDVLKSAPVFVPAGGPPKHVAYVPHHRSHYGNDRYGDCVTAEEAFAKSCAIPGSQPESVVPDEVVIGWARSHGVLNGASLSGVLDAMAARGFDVSPRLLNDGPKRLVDFRDEQTLRAAIAMGPVKIAIPAHMLGPGAGSRDGWHALGGSSRGSDHAVSLCGFGTAEWLYGELGVPLPSGLKADTFGFLCYTWSTIGFVDSAWVRGNVREAWIREPTTVAIPPFVRPPHPSAPGLLARVWHLLVAFACGLMVAVIVGFVWRPLLAILGPVLPSWLRLAV